jgi:hypothetical protein
VASEIEPFSASAVTIVSTVTPFAPSLTLAENEMGSSGVTACLTLSDEQLASISVVAATASNDRKFTGTSYGETRSLQKSPERAVGHVFGRQ